jgi:FixJ family two-component response regulator
MSPATQSGAVPRISIVDDDEAVRLAIGMLVESCGWEARGYASAREFLDEPACSRPGCLILDLDMPGMNGVELLHRLEAEGRPLPTIVVTGYADSPLADEARRSGVRAVIKKPFRDDLLIDRLREALQGVE